MASGRLMSELIALFTPFSATPILSLLQGFLHCLPQDTFPSRKPSESHTKVIGNSISLGNNTIIFCPKAAERRQ